MATISKEILSGSTNGLGIKVVATSTAGTLIHTAVSGTDDIDEIWLWAVNTHTSALLLTIEFGGATVPDNLITITLQPNEPTLVVPGLTLQNAKVVRAFAASANLIVVYGFANEIDLA